MQTSVGGVPEGRGHLHCGQSVHDRYTLTLILHSHTNSQTCYCCWLTCVYLPPGGALLARPVTEPGVQEVSVLLPGAGQVRQTPGLALCGASSCGLVVLLRLVSFLPGLVRRPLCSHARRRQDCEPARHSAHCQCPRWRCQHITHCFNPGGMFQHLFKSGCLPCETQLFIKSSIYTQSGHYTYIHLFMF